MRVWDCLCQLEHGVLSDAEIVRSLQLLGTVAAPGSGKANLLGKRKLYTVHAICMVCCEVHLQNCNSLSGAMERVFRHLISQVTLTAALPHSCLLQSTVLRYVWIPIYAQALQGKPADAARLTKHVTTSPVPNCMMLFVVHLQNKVCHHHVTAAAKAHNSVGLCLPAAKFLVYQGPTAFVICTTPD